MLTKWYKNAMRFSALPSIDNTGNDKFKVKNTAGNFANLSATAGGGGSSVRYLTSLYGANSWNWAVLTTSNNTTGIVVGSGNTVPSEDDYCLESQITSGISTSVYKEKVVDSSNNPGIKFQITINNTSENSITISEIGIQVAGVSSRAVLMDRTLLDAPVTIAAGDYAIIIYEVYVDVSDLSSLT